MKPATEIKHYVPKTYLKEKLNLSFTLLCWNVYKKSHKAKQAGYLSELLTENPSDLVLFQETNFLKENQKVLKGYEQYYFSNLTFKHKSYGLLNASNVSSIHVEHLTSFYREFFFRTHKAFLSSLYPLEGENLLVINVHAINFRRAHVFKKEIERLRLFALNHKGPLIIAGDFNTWNKRRLLFLYDMVRQLKLKQVKCQQSHLIKKFLKYPLDHVFYRGLKVEEAYVLNCQEYSDHNPLFVKFNL